MLLQLPIITELQESISDFGAFPKFYLCLFVIIPLSLVFSFICLILIFRKINSLEKKTVKMREFNELIQEGAQVYLKDQTRMLLLILALLFVPVGLTGVKFLQNPFLGFFITGTIFLLGSFSSLFAGYIGMKTATKANILVVEA
ncbi:MAG: sodium/proton-translocating pyrophosphatase, partial [Promethearchaeota archaeon]